MSTRRTPMPIGQKYGRLLVLECVNHDKERGAYYFKCLCDCGDTSVVREDCLKTGNTKSCGCYYRETRGVNKTHGMWNTRTYKIWSGMKARCTSEDKKHHLYAGKGVKVCDRWLQFVNFLEDMGECQEGLTIDRIDGNGDYCPGNCRWATPKEQANNSAANHIVNYLGESLNIGQWAERMGIKANTLVYRIKRGWPVDKALTTPVQHRASQSKTIERLQA